MTDISLDLSGKIDAPTEDLLRTITTVTKQLHLNFFVTGATALDMILKHGYGIELGRTTLDVDLGVGVTTWDMYARLKANLVFTAQFAEDSGITHRLRFRDVLPVDFIPFGAVESPPGSIGWPPDQNPTMNVLGFGDAWSHSLLVRLQPELAVRFSSLPGMAALKLIAWTERRHDAPDKDAADIAVLLRHYAEAGNTDRLYEDQADLLKEEGFDLSFAGARLLGRDMSVMMNPRTKKFIAGTLKRSGNPEQNDVLIVDVARHLPGREYERAHRLLANLMRGIEEIEFQG